MKIINLNRSDELYRYFIISILIMFFISENPANAYQGAELFLQWAQKDQETSSSIDPSVSVVKQEKISGEQERQNKFSYINFSDNVPRIKPEKNDKSALIIAQIQKDVIKFSARQDHDYNGKNRRLADQMSPDFSRIRQEFSFEDVLKAEKDFFVRIKEPYYQYNSLEICHLASLYLAYGHYPEALSVLEMPFETVEKLSNCGDLLSIARFGARHYKDILDHSPQKPEGREKIWLALANSATGNYHDADRWLKKINANVIWPKSFLHESLLLRAETAIYVGDNDELEVLFLRLGNASLKRNQQYHFDFLRALHQARHTSLHEETFNQAVEILNGLEKFPMPYSGRAQIEQIRLELSAQNLTPEQAQKRLNNLGVQWRGGIFERDYLSLKGQLSEVTGAYDDAFMSYRRLITDFPNSNNAKIAKVNLQNLFAEVMNKTDQLDVLKATRLFYENIDLLALGREGDRQIRRAAESLAELDLLLEASELLEHQVFKRLRGRERATVAIDLARLYLNDRKPHDALRVIRHTRITGLNEEIIAARREVEATALWYNGDAQSALIRLSFDNPDELNLSARKLKAKIALDINDIDLAGQEYFAVAKHILSTYKQQNTGTEQKIFASDERFIMDALAILARGNDQQLFSDLISMISNENDFKILGKMAQIFNRNSDISEFLEIYNRWVNENALASESTLLSQLENTGD